MATYEQSLQQWTPYLRSQKDWKSLPPQQLRAERSGLQALTPQQTAQQLQVGRSGLQAIAPNQLDMQRDAQQQASGIVSGYTDPRREDLRKVSVNQVAPGPDARIQPQTQPRIQAYLPPLPPLRPRSPQGLVAGYAASVGMPRTPTMPTAPRATMPAPTPGPQLAPQTPRQIQLQVPRSPDTPQLGFRTTR